MCEMLFIWAFNDFLPLRLLASFFPASSRAKLGDAACGFQSNFALFDYAKKAHFSVKPTSAGHFSNFF
jgi:hypothetical protein